MSKKYEIYISYIYYEKENTRKNLEFFIKHGLKPNHYLMINCRSEKISVDVSGYENIEIFKSPHNVGFCMRGHVDNLSRIKQLDDFKYCILMNDSVRGPYYRGSEWESVFKLKIDQGFDMCGTINNQGYFNFMSNTHAESFLKYAKSGYGKDIITYKDAVDVEMGAPRGNKTNLTDLKWWNEPHTPWDVVFVKQNRIGKFQGNDNEWTAKVLSYITDEVLENCDQEMDSIANV